MTSQPATRPPTCIIEGDRPLVERINAHSRVPVIFLCDHAGNQVPDEFGDLGVDDEMLGRHIGWDIGAADVTRHMAETLGAEAIFNHVSRLVIDPNRRPRTPGSILAVSDGCFVPRNERPDDEDVRRRIERYFLPYHRTVARAIARRTREGQVPAIIAVHSFTPVMDGEVRPWHVGVMWRGDDRLARPVLEGLRERKNLVIGDNQPYSGFRAFGYTVNFHAQRSHSPHIMFELRHDEIDTREKALVYADLLVDILKPTLADSRLYRKYEGDNLAESGGLMSWRHASLVSP